MHSHLSCWMFVTTSNQHFQYTFQIKVLEHFIGQNGFYCETFEGMCFGKFSDLHESLWYFKCGYCQLVAFVCYYNIRFDWDFNTHTPAVTLILIQNNTLLKASSLINLYKIKQLKLCLAVMSIIWQPSEVLFTLTFFPQLLFGTGLYLFKLVFI